MIRAHEPATSALARLRRAADADLAAALIAPGDPRYASARMVWNAAIDRRPAAVLRATSTEMVGRAIRAARAAEIPIAVRGGGHGTAGFATIDGGLVIDLSPMREVHVEPDRRIAVAGGGATWADYDAATAAHGLASTGGLVSSTGVAGLTLGGGVGWLARWMGLACDSFTGATLVRADGTARRVDAGTDPDLLWGLRGGGGNFGVATELEFRLRPVSSVIGGSAWFPGARAASVSRAFRELAASAPDELGCVLTFLTAPDDPAAPESLRGGPAVVIGACHVGSSAAAASALAPVRALGPVADDIGATPYPALQRTYDADFSAGRRHYLKGGFTAGIPDGMIEVIESWMARAPSASSELDLHLMGGAIGRVPEGDTAFPDRRSPILFNILTGWDAPALDERNRGWVRGFAAALARFGDGRSYVNFLSEAESPEALRDGYTTSRFERLLDLKRRHDPDNVFAGNQNVWA